jgi:hypothetical protein
MKIHFGRKLFGLIFIKKQDMQIHGQSRISRYFKVHHDYQPKFDPIRVFYVSYGRNGFIKSTPGLGRDHQRRPARRLGLGDRPLEAGVCAVGPPVVGVHVPVVDAGGQSRWPEEEVSHPTCFFNFFCQNRQHR